MSFFLTAPRVAVVMAALSSLTFPLSAAAAEKEGGWLGSVGDFITDGLGPARTMDDIRREEEKARNAKAEPLPPTAATPSQSKPSPPREMPLAVITPPPAAAVAVPLPAPVTAPAIPAASAPMVVTKPVAKPPMAPSAVKAAAVAVPVAVPAPQPRPVQPAVVRPLPEPSEPEPLASRIAATATLDQARKLGGLSETSPANAR